MLNAYLKQIDEHIHFSHIQRKVFNVDFHLHRGCEIYFLLHGDVNYFVEKTVYPLQFGDLVITNEHEIHKPSFSTEAIYERITVEFNPAIAALFQTSDFLPLDCFYNRPNGERNKLTLNSKETISLMNMFMKYETLQKNSIPGDAILKMSCFMEMLVFINRLFTEQKQPDTGMNLHHKLSPVLEYIERHLDEDLTLDQLESRFFINKFYLIKLFKKYTGSTIHEYIIYKRISMAKKLLSEGYNVTETCLRCGFNDYTSFLRMFKKKVGQLPKDFQKETQFVQL